MQAKGTGKQTHERAHIDQQAQHRHAADLGHNVHWILTRTQILARRVEAQDFRVRTDGEENSGQNGAMDDRTGNRLQRIARFGP